MEFEWGEGHAGTARTMLGAARHDESSGADSCEAETIIEFRSLYYMGRDPGVWWQTVQSPLVFASLPRGLIEFIYFGGTRSVRPDGKLFLRKVADDITVAEEDIRFMYTLPEPVAAATARKAAHYQRWLQKKKTTKKTSGQKAAAAPVAAAAPIAKKKQVEKVNKSAKKEGAIGAVDDAPAKVKRAKKVKKAGAEAAKVASGSKKKKKR